MNDTSLETESFARRFLLGELIKACTARLKAQPIAYGLMPKKKQEELLAEIAEDVREAVRIAVQVIASDNRIMFQANCASVTFKDDGVKATLEMANTDYAHSLANAAGRAVLVVLEDGSRYLNEGDSLIGQDDNRPLFDESTEGH